MSSEIFEANFLRGAQIEDLEQQQAAQEMGVTFESSISGAESSLQSIYSRLDTEFDLQEKPLPDSKIILELCSLLSFTHLSESWKHNAENIHYV